MPEMKKPTITDYLRGAEDRMMAQVCAGFEKNADKAVLLAINNKWSPDRIAQFCGIAKSTVEKYISDYRSPNGIKSAFSGKLLAMYPPELHGDSTSQWQS